MKNILYILILLSFFACKREPLVNNYRIKELKEYDVTADTIFMTNRFEYNTNGQLNKVSYPLISSNFYSQYDYFNDSIVIHFKPPTPDLNWQLTGLYNPQKRISKIFTHEVRNTDNSNLSYAIYYSTSGTIDSIIRPINYYFPRDTTYLKESNFQYENGNCIRYNYANAYEHIVWPFQNNSGNVTIKYTNKANPGYFPFQNLIGFTDLKFYGYLYQTTPVSDPAYLFTLTDKNCYPQNQQLIQDIKIYSAITLDTVTLHYNYTTISDTVTQLEIFNNNTLQFKYIIITEAY